MTGMRFSLGAALGLRDQYMLRPRGMFTLHVMRGDRLIEQVAEKNLIVVGSQQAHSRLLGGSTVGNIVTTIGYGTNLTAAVFGNTSLAGAYTKALDSVSYPASNEVTFAFSLGYSEANGLAIGEFGLLTGGSALYARKVRSAALVKDTDISLSGTWTIIF